MARRGRRRPCARPHKGPGRPRPRHPAGGNGSGGAPRERGASRAEGERLQKIIARAGIASRRSAEALILAGRVSVNGKIVRELGARADPARDRIAVDGDPLRSFPRPRYLLLHKPRGVVSTLADPGGRPTLRDLIAGVPERLFPVGRLDASSTGLLLLTNDGELAASLAHPRHAVPRTYRVKVRGVPDARALARLARGVRLPPVRRPGQRGARAGGAGRRREPAAAAARVSVVERRGTKSWLEITVTEGRYHIVRRMCAAVGHPVEKLCRVRLGPLALGKLPLGGVRQLSAREVEALRRAAGLGSRGTGTTWSSVLP